MKKLLLAGLLSTTLCTHAAQTPAEKYKPLTQKENIVQSIKVFLIFGGAVTGVLCLGALDHMMVKNHPIARSFIIGSIVGLCAAYAQYKNSKPAEAQSKDATQTTSH